MISRHMMGVALVFVFVFVGWPQTLLAELEETPVASIELEKEVHFLTPDEATVVVPSGYYTVEAEKNGLQLTRGLLPDEGGEAFLLQAKPGTHEEQLDGPIARSTAVEEDAHYLTLLLPDGQSLEVIGSYSGVWPRGASWWERARQKAKNSLVAVKDKYEEVPEWNRLCKKRSSKVNDINNCCASKYTSCKRVCRKKGKQRVSCQRQCETLNEGCWIRRDANPNWMVNYCGKTQNQRRARTNSRAACCQKMEIRCKKSCQSFPLSGREEICGRCTEAANLCQSNTREEFFEEGDTIAVKPPREEVFRWKPLPDSQKAPFQKSLAKLEEQINRNAANDPRRSRYACYLKKLKRPDVDDRIIKWPTICQATVNFIEGCEVRARVKESDLIKYIKSKNDVEPANRKISPSIITHLRSSILWHDEAGINVLSSFRITLDEAVDSIHRLGFISTVGMGGGSMTPRYYRAIKAWLQDRQKDPKSVLSCK